VNELETDLKKQLREDLELLASPIQLAAYDRMANESALDKYEILRRLTMAGCLIFPAVVYNVTTGTTRTVLVWLTAAMTLAIIFRELLHPRTIGANLMVLGFTLAVLTISFIGKSLNEIGPCIALFAAGALLWSLAHRPDVVRYHERVPSSSQDD